MPQDLLNTDFSRRIVISTDQLPWVSSPQPGVERRLLDRIGGEVARATSIVRYAPVSAERVAMERLGAGVRLAEFDCPGGEEIFVLSGELADEHGAYGSGTWIRNPAGYRRSLKSAHGATYWAKRGHLPTTTG